jgi:hypothetical protein
MQRVLCVLLIGSGLLACKTAATPGRAAAISQQFDINDQQMLTLSASGSALRIKLAKVDDSRCPTGVQCLVAGYANVDVELTDATAITQIARISLLFSRLPNYTRDSVSVTLNQQQYWLRLLDVKPYPSGSGSPTKTATLRLRPY